jgi:hypothetical protein
LGWENIREVRDKLKKEGGYLRTGCEKKQKDNNLSIEDEVYDSKRCAAYKTKKNQKDIKNGKIEIGCLRDKSDEQEQECVLDDPLCNHDYCEEPEGWCYRMWDWNDGLSWQFEEIGDIMMNS